MPTETFRTQDKAAVAGLADGGFVVTWQSDWPSSTGLDIRGQRYRADGEAAGPEFVVNQMTDADQENAAVVALADGGFFVTWQSNSHPAASNGLGVGVYGRRFGADGVAFGAETLLNTHVAGDQGKPAAVALAHGDVLALWQSGGQDSAADGNGIYGQRLAAERGAGGDAAGERLHGVEHLDGSPHADALSGAGGANHLRGGGDIPAVSPLAASMFRWPAVAALSKKWYTSRCGR